MNGEPERYFHEVVLTYEGDECLTWPYARANGYGSMHYEGRIGPVHRRVCEEVNGPPPTPKHSAAHSCGKGHEGCVTKRHVSWKTHTENMADKVLHGTAPRGENNHFAKLTEGTVLAIRSMETTSPREIAKKFGVDPSLISLIISRKVWGWLDP